MTKEHESHKENKKKPAMKLKDKRLAKQVKRAAKSSS
jgi:hypothetical protein